MSDRTLTTLEVCKRLSISKRTFYRLAEGKELKVFRIGREFRVRPEALDEYIEKKEGANQ